MCPQLRCSFTASRDQATARRWSAGAEGTTSSAGREARRRSKTSRGAIVRASDDLGEVRILPSPFAPVGDAPRMRMAVSQRMPPVQKSPCSTSLRGAPRGRGGNCGAPRCASRWRPEGASIDPGTRCACRGARWDVLPSWSGDRASALERPGTPGARPSARLSRDGSGRRHPILSRLHEHAPNGWAATSSFTSMPRSEDPRGASATNARPPWRPASERLMPSVATRIVPLRPSAPSAQEPRGGRTGTSSMPTNQ